MATTIIDQTGLAVNVDLVGGKGALVTTSGGSPGPSPTPPTTILSGRKTIAVAGTPEVLAASTTCKQVTIQANKTNSGLMIIGNSTSQDVELSAGENIDIRIDNLNKIYVDAQVNGEGVKYLGEA